MPRNSTRDLQRALNAFTKRYLAKVAPLRADGERGKATNSRIMAVKFFLGYGRDRDSAATREFRKRLAHPRNPKLFGPKMFATGAGRRAKQRARTLSERFKATVAPNVTTFDGVPCAIWIAKNLQRLRDEGRWKGRLVSGWRSPAYSESLCRKMCGAPSCAGTCAGRASNHSGSVFPAGAADVSDYMTAIAECARLGLPLRNDLPADRVHLSNGGR